MSFMQLVCSMLWIGYGDFNAKYTILDHFSHTDISCLNRYILLLKGISYYTSSSFDFYYFHLILKWGCFRVCTMYFINSNYICIALVQMKEMIRESISFLRHEWISIFLLQALKILLKYQRRIYSILPQFNF